MALPLLFPTGIGPKFYRNLNLTHAILGNISTNTPTAEHASPKQDGFSFDIITSLDRQIGNNGSGGVINK